MVKVRSILWKAHYLPLGLLALYPVVLVLLTIPWFQRQFIFLQWVRWPIGADFDNPERYGLAPYKTRNLQISTPDGETLGAWHVLPQSTYQALEPFPPRGPLDHGTFERSLRDRPTILYFHGNAATRAASHRVRGYSAYSALDCNVLAVDYRGFADSTGVPSEQGLITDARAVWNYVQGMRAEVDDVALVGQSLGTGVVAGLAGQLAVEGIHPRAIVLVAPFTSVVALLESFWIFGIVPLLSPIRSIPWLVDHLKSYIQYPFNSTSALSATRSPILILHARDDDVIPHPHSAKLFQSLRTLTPEAKLHEISYKGWGTVRTLVRAGGDIVWWDGLRGGHNDIGWAEGSIDLVRRIARL